MAVGGTTAETTISISPSEPLLLIVTQGDFGSSTQTAHVSTNNYTGYTLLFNTDSETTDLVNTTDSSIVIPTISLGDSSITSDSFPVGYGYSIDGVNYRPAPGFTTEGGERVAIADVIKTTDAAGEGQSQLKFGVKVPEDFVLGDYQNRFQLTAIANDINYSIKFDENAGDDAVSNVPEEATGTFNGTGIPITISDQIPNRYPYTFIGWSLDETLNGQSVLYQPGETFYLDPTKNNTQTLYAHWEFRCHPNATTISNSKDATILTDAICMQDMNITVARDMEDEVQYTLYDSRDEKPYFVAMLKDGNVWMTQNLDLGDAEKTYTLTSDDTDLQEGQTFVLPTFADPETVSFDTDIYEEEQKYVVNHPVVRDGGEKYYVPETRTLNYIVYDSLGSCVEKTDEETCRHYHVGNYYNHYALTVGTMGDLSSITEIEAVAKSSICPAGWRLTTAINEDRVGAKSFQNLIRNGYSGVYDSTSGNTTTAIMAAQAPLYFIKAGYYTSSATKQDDSYVFRVYLYDTAFYFPTDTVRLGRMAASYISGSAFGNTNFTGSSELPVRCIARDNAAFNITVNYYDDSTLNKTETIEYNSEEPSRFHISSEEPVKDGYTFLGWSDNENSNEPVYQPGDSLLYSTKNIPMTDQTLNLYAIWEESTNLLTTISTMQEMTPEICNGTTTPSTNYGAPSAQLTDTRDGKKYWVSKLADGNCWMTQNLDLGGKETAYTLTPEDSDVAENFTLPAEDTITNKSIIDNTVYASSDSVVVMGEAIDHSTCLSEYDETTCEHYSAGSYYNYYATTAGTGGTDFSSGEVLDSICPVGWMLPRNTGIYSFQGFISKYNLEIDVFAAFEKPIYLVLGGSYNFASTSPNTSMGQSSSYQTRVVLYPMGARELALSKSTVNAQNYYSVKTVGKTIRCVARPYETYTLSYNNNGGSGSPAALTGAPTNTGHYTYTLSSIVPTRSGFTFAGWNTKADGTGVTAQPRDSFSVSGSKTLYATWNYTLNYDGNGGSSVPQSGTRAGGSTTTFVVTSEEPVNGDKVFLGWSTNPDSDSPLYLGETPLTVNVPSTTLYAIWGDEGRGLATIETMQEMTGDICEATSVHYSKQLVDIRDGKKYWVAKLADGNCWMTQDLNLGDRETTYILTPNDSDVYTDFVLSADGASTPFINYDEVAFRTSRDRYTTHIDINTMYTSTYSWNSLAECVEGTGLDEETCLHYRTGAYYNYYTVTAGTGIANTEVYTIANSSICPSGWRLPLGRSSASNLVSEYSKLLFAEGALESATNTTGTVGFKNASLFSSSPLFFARSGYYSSTQVGSGNNVGSVTTSQSNLNSNTLLWESTSRSGTSADTMYAYIDSYVSPQYSFSKLRGISARCVARSNETYTLSYEANGGEDAPVAQTSAVTGSGRYTFTLSSDVPSRSGFTFAGWNTKVDGTGETYQPGSEFVAHGSTTLYAIWEYSLIYNANGGSGAPANVTGVGGETASFVIDELAPTKENAYFWGWSTSSDSEVGDYSPLDRITLTEPETTLYAIWNDSVIPLDTITYMQEINSNICRETPNGYSKQLVDQRDGKSYWVTKLADGNCWMTQNLDLGDTERDYFLTPEDSDIKENFTLTKRDYSEAINTSEGNVVRFNDGDAYYVINDSYANYNTYSTAEECASSETSLNEETCKHYHSGNQYNYYTATAGSITMEDYGNTEATSSICPAGWRLPTAYNNMGTNIKSHYNLYLTAYGILNSASGSLMATQSPLYITPWYSSSYFISIGFGSLGGYWSSTAASLNNGRTVEFDNTRFTHLDSSNKATYGYNVRCVARNTPVDYTITYNYQDGVTEAKMVTVPFDGETRSIMIEAKAPEREGYNFVGWGTSAEATEPSYMPGDLFDEFYTNSNMITDDQTLNLYAIWEESTNLLTTISTMQEMTPEICNGTTTPSTNYGAPSAQLTDTRDGKKYWVSKLADGNCWMTQNLDLGDKETAYTLTPEDSDVAENFTLPAEPEKLFNAENYNVTNFRNKDLYVVTSRLTDWSDYVYKTKDECDAVYGEGNTFCEHYHVGGYYNWYTATAGAGIKETTADYIDTYTSICPAGWRLPKGRLDANTPSEFAVLTGQYNITSGASTALGNVGYAENGFNIVRNNPLYFVRGGYYGGSDLSNLQSYAYYNGATNNSMQYEYSFYFASNNVQPNSRNTKYYGFSTRCVARGSETHTLYYDENGGTSAPVAQSKISSTGHVTMQISSILPERPGYEFKGYNRDRYAETVEYNPGDTVTFAGKSLRLYAVWEEAFTCHSNATTIGDIDSASDVADGSKAICMQDMNTSVAKSMVENQQYRLIDIRDNSTYYVARLKDGNIWMTQNLDLGNSIKSYTLTPTDSDVKENFTMPTATSDPFNIDTIDQVNYRDPGEIFYVNSGDTTADIQANSLDECTDLGLDEVTCRHYHAGNYYNWYTATAGTGTSNMVNNYEMAESSICPAGWRLPIALSTVTVSSDFSALLYQYDVISAVSTSTGNVGYKTGGLNAIRTAPLYFTRTGYYNNSAISYPKTEDTYWSSTNWTSGSSLGLHFYANNIRTNYGLSKQLGRNIRCVAKNTAIEYTVNYHQNDGTDSVSTETKEHTGTNGKYEVIVKTEIPVREGHIFLGWGTSATDTAPSYVPGQIFDSSSIVDMLTENQTLDLYAIWEESTNLLTTISTMQEMTPEICNGTTTPSTNYGAPSAQLTDTRDGKKYWVSKLADGNCWMTQNLDLGDKETAYTLTPEDSDVAENFTLPAEPSGVLFNNLNYDIVNFRDSGELYQVTSNKTTTDTDWIFFSKEQCESVYGETYCEHYHAGNYYNWYTATAGDGEYDYNVNLSTLPSSICPAGWRLPKAPNISAGNSDFAQLLSHNITTTLNKNTSSAAYQTDAFRTIRNSSIYATRSGYYNNNAIASNGANGYYWTSTVASSPNAYSLYYINTYAYPNSSQSKYIGRTMRCVARSEETITLTYNANGGTDAPTSQTSASTNLGHTTFTLSSFTPLRDGFTFVGWNTKSDGTGRMYQPGDEYPASGSTSLYAIWTYTLNYTVDGGESFVRTVTADDGASHAFVIDDIMPTKEGSVFLGWSEDQNATVGEYAGSILRATNSITTVYAIWGVNGPALSQIDTMQEMTSEICTNTPIGYSKQLEDIRDGNSYFVTKMEDGKCWMTQNLDFVPVAGKTYYGDDADSNHTPDTDIGFGSSDAGNTWTPVSVSATETLTNDTANHYIYRDTGERYFVPDNTIANDVSYTTKESCEVVHGAEKCAHYHTGNYYNWYTAVAGSGVYGTGSGGNYTSVNNSICPYGWRLPLGRTGASTITEYAELIKAYGAVDDVPLNYNAIPLKLKGLNTLRNDPLYITRAGFFYNARALDNGGNRMVYWTSTNYSVNHAYGFYSSDSSAVTPNTYHTKNQAFNVRCVAR